MIKQILATGVMVAAIAIVDTISIGIGNFLCRHLRRLFLIMIKVAAMCRILYRAVGYMVRPLLRVKLQKESRIRRVIQLLPYRDKPGQRLDNVAIDKHVGRARRLGVQGLNRQEFFAVHGFGRGPVLFGIAPIVRNNAKLRGAFGTAQAGAIALHGEERFRQLVGRWPRRWVWLWQNALSPLEEAYQQQQQQQNQFMAGTCW
mmetsp:Transcript_24998/g.69175  ORF Transcript_24998/g.69175 Transcript_24998/m.69175 type:complete len:202 (-) Transcript_24998:45-650(-)